MIANVDIRQEAKSAKLTLWKIADALNISEPTMTRKLRRDLLEAEKDIIRGVIAKLKEVEQDGSHDNQSPADIPRNG